MLEKTNRIITDERELVNMLNDHYINIVENNSDIIPNPIQLEGKDNTEASILEIIEKFKNHTSITKIKETDIFKENYFTFRKTNEEEIERLFVELNTKASTGEDKIPPKLAKLAKYYLKKSMTEAINSSITSGVFPNKVKRAIVTPLDKGGKDKTSISNYRPVSVLSVFSKIYERAMKNQMVSFLEYKLSSYLSVYRKSYSTQHVLIRLIEEWKGYLDKNYYVGAVLLDISKAFDCVPHDLIIAKMHAYDFNMDALKLILSYLTNREQATCINSIYSMFQEISSGVPQGYILGPIIFNIFVNDLLLFLVNCNVHNYADDNTISSFPNSINDLVKKLEKETNLALSWLTNNSIFLSRSKENIINIELKIGDKIIKSEQEVELLGVKIDNHLKFESHVKHCVNQHQHN